MSNKAKTIKINGTEIKVYDITSLYPNISNRYMKIIQNDKNVETRGPWLVAVNDPEPMPHKGLAFVDELDFPKEPVLSRSRRRRRTD